VILGTYKVGEGELEVHAVDVAAAAGVAVSRTALAARLPPSDIQNLPPSENSFVRFETPSDSAAQFV
jgi:hypothetical protein